MITEDMKLAVKKGAVWLDQAYPGWASTISLYDLDMSECQDCIIGQVIGDFNYIISSDKSVYWAIEYGFEVDYDTNDWESLQGEYAKLEVLWTDEVEKRLG